MVFAENLASCRARFGVFDVQLDFVLLGDFDVDAGENGNVFVLLGFGYDLHVVFQLTSKLYIFES